MYDAKKAEPKQPNGQASMGLETMRRAHVRHIRRP
jgi:hypothetical protein